MPMLHYYELRLNGRLSGLYEKLEEALTRAKVAVVLDPDCDPEIIDQRTGRASMLCASKRWRDEIAEKIGF